MRRTEISFYKVIYGVVFYFECSGYDNLNNDNALMVIVG